MLCSGDLLLDFEHRLLHLPWKFMLCNGVLAYFSMPHTPHIICSASVSSFSMVTRDFFFSTWRACDNPDTCCFSLLIFWVFEVEFFWARPNSQLTLCSIQITRQNCILSLLFFWSSFWEERDWCQTAMCGYTPGWRMHWQANKWKHGHLPCYNWRSSAYCREHAGWWI